ncbi:MAG: DNA polymerase III subunit delta [Patescibacteria group bacterium]|nr:DNA polymerase III subunit delta [Patescibacteria group bacterium]MDD5490948.1 DNA polymerase III subunit delta [Patescibacteria group bacterium]
MIIYLCGEDTFRSRQKQQELKEKFIRERDKSGLNVAEIDGAKISFGELEQQILTAPFLSEKRFVAISNLSENKATAEEMVEFLEKHQKRDDVIMAFWEEGSPKNKLTKFLSEQKYFQEFVPLDDSALGHWISEEVKKRGGRINSLAVRTLVEYVGNNLWQLSNELDKLLAYKNKQEILKEDVEELVRTKFDDNIFGLVDALGNKNKKEALRLLKNQLSFGSSASYIISMLNRQYRILLEVQEALGETSNSLARRLKIHPFVAKKALVQARRYNFEELKNIYRQLLEIDKKTKTTSWEPELLVDLLMAKV